MGTILGDFFKNVGGGLGKVFDGEVLDGLGDVLSGIGDGMRRTVNGALNLVGLGEEETPPAVNFFLCEVALLAKIAKSDGRVDKAEIEFMQTLFDECGLDTDAQKNLKEFFNEQKKNLDDIGEWAVGAFQSAVQMNPKDEDGGLEVRLNLYRHLFLMALADGKIDDAEVAILRAIPDPLGLTPEVFDFVCHELLGDDANERCNSSDVALAEAFATLGVSPDASDAEVRKAWKNKLAAFHPDKIQGKDLAPEWMELANQKSAEINQAYETIKASRR